MKIEDLETFSKKVKSKIDKIEGIKYNIESQFKKYDTEVKNLKHQITIREKTVTLFKQLLDKLIDENVTTLSRLVTEGLRIVVPDQKIEFQAKVEQKNDLWIKFTTIENGVSGNVLDSFGGMVACLESFILRVLCILKLKLKRILILDEAFAQVSSEYLENTSYLIKKLCDDFKIDMLLVTHQKKLLKHADNVYYAKSETKDSKKQLVLVKDESET